MSTLGKCGNGSGCGGAHGDAGVPLQPRHEEEPCQHWVSLVMVVGVVGNVVILVYLCSPGIRRNHANTG